MSLRVHSLSARRRPLPGDGNSQDAFHGLVQGRCRRREREADEIVARGAKSGSRNRSDTGVFEQNLTNLYGSQARGRDVDPGVEGAIRRLAAEAAHVVEVAHKLLAAASELGNHAGRGTFPVA